MTGHIPGPSQKKLALNCVGDIGFLDKYLICPVCYCYFLIAIDLLDDRWLAVWAERVADDNTERCSTHFHTIMELVLELLFIAQPRGRPAIAVVALKHNNYGIAKRLC